MAWVDAEKMDVVIYNLLGNAIKFSPEGKSNPHQNSNILAGRNIYHPCVR